MQDGVFVLSLSALTLLYGWLHGKRVALKRYKIRVSQPLPYGKSPRRSDFGSAYGKVHRRRQTRARSVRSSARRRRISCCLRATFATTRPRLRTCSPPARCWAMFQPYTEPISYSATNDPRRPRPRAEVPGASLPRRARTKRNPNSGRRLRYRFRFIHRGRPPGRLDGTFRGRAHSAGGTAANRGQVENRFC